MLKGGKPRPFLWVWLSLPLLHTRVVRVGEKIQDIHKREPRRTWAVFGRVYQARSEKWRDFLWLQNLVQLTCKRASTWGFRGKPWNYKQSHFVLSPLCTWTLKTYSSRTQLAMDLGSQLKAVFPLQPASTSCFPSGRGTLLDPLVLGPVTELTLGYCKPHLWSNQRPFRNDEERRFSILAVGHNCLDENLKIRDFRNHWGQLLYQWTNLF